jgi:HAD superfamily hydrolase (TIGR01509 family)
MNEALIFDLDGLLARTEELHSRSWRETLNNHGCEVSEEQYADHWIRQGESYLEFVELHELNDKADQLLLEKNLRFEELVNSNLEPMPGALELLTMLHGLVPMCLASSARREPVTHVTKTLRIAHFFEFILTFQDCENHKPHPEPFLMSAKKLGASPDRCVVFEDAEKGVLAAHNAGMKCIAVPNEHTLDHDFSTATLVVDSLSELTWEQIRVL